MAIPSSGELKLWDDIWNQEIGGSQGENSLHSASVYAEFSTPDAMSDFYGWADVDPPSVSSQNAQSAGPTCICARGTVNDTGKEDPETGFYLGRSWSSPTSNAYYSAGTNGVGTYTRNVTGLSQVTTYYYWAYACNSAGSSTGARIGQATNEVAFSPTIVCMCGDQGWVGLWGEPTVYENYGSCFQQYWVNPYSGQNKHLISANYGAGQDNVDFDGGGGCGKVATNATNRHNAGMNNSLRMWNSLGSCFMRACNTLSPFEVYFAPAAETGTGPAYCPGSTSYCSIRGYLHQPGSGPVAGNSNVQWTFGLQSTW